MKKDNIYCDKDEWIGAKVQCDICMHKWVGVFSLSSDKLECPNCHNMVNYEIVE